MTRYTQQTKLLHWIDELAAAEEATLQAPFLAPCVQGGCLRMSVNGLVHSLQPKPKTFEGWGVFLPADEKTAQLQTEAELPQVMQYLSHLQPLSLWLVQPLQGRTWLACPVNNSDAQQRMGYARPVAVRLVQKASQFDRIIGRFDGSSWWFEGLDRRADPVRSAELRSVFSLEHSAQQIHGKDVTPELRHVWSLAHTP